MSYDVDAGPLGVFLRDPAVTDVLVNGPGPVWIDRGGGVERTHVVVGEEASLRRLAQRLVSSAGRRLDDAMPHADTRLSHGNRGHAGLPPARLPAAPGVQAPPPPVSPQGTCLSLRVPPRRTFRLDELVAAGSLSAAGADLLHRIVAARLAFLVTGGTGTGKTTVLSTLLSLVAPGERIVLVEDAAE